VVVPPLLLPFLPCSAFPPLICPRPVCRDSLSCESHAYLEMMHILIYLNNTTKITEPALRCTDQPWVSISISVKLLADEDMRCGFAPKSL
jgi:hypothetical protein